MDYTLVSAAKWPQLIYHAECKEVNIGFNTKRAHKIHLFEGVEWGAFAVHRGAIKREVCLLLIFVNDFCPVIFLKQAIFMLTNNALTEQL